eukprot:Gregarina_sp_Poly_1__10464@NODE_761_length_6399_cov_244_304169_g561_i0_p1_GENE_NODE_761_length_6399_cov_244_304169_g561_i0NODE_761_length_6399_cov_244_304169_g561_i0_p1_ORF_typecomplete_len517_score65_62NAD_binding_5/PF07994_12/1_1e155Inos1P_synth/PF01658_17/1_6e50_NODE_761_length_6399_cov_244_304169_g561_i030944644
MLSNIQCATPNGLVSTPAEERDGYLYSDYLHQATRVEKLPDSPHLNAVCESQIWRFKTRVNVPKTGVLLVGLGGNNGSTLACALIANQRNISWEDKFGIHRADWLGSVAMMGTCKLGYAEDGTDIYVPIRSLLPMLHPNDIVIGGWDISKCSLVEAAKRAQVLPLAVQQQVASELNDIPVWPGVYIRDFIATNQEIRADNVIVGSLADQLGVLRGNIADFKKRHNLQKVIVVWTGNTERFAKHQVGVHDTEAGFLQAIEQNNSEIAPSSLYAAAAVLENCSFINGSPQNTFCDGLIQLATSRGVFLIGDDLKTGQTKIKSALADFLVTTALKPTSIVSYNHLGNNDGLNLSSEEQFRSKEMSKSSVVDDMIASNALLFPEEGKKPDHLIVIKYVPSVGDSKRAMDEYTAKICMNGTQTIVMHNTCEDSLLAVPIILDLVIFCELFERIQVMQPAHTEYRGLHPMLSLLSLFLKAPQVPKHAPVVNALFPQKEALTAFIRAASGLPPIDYISLEHRI